jgi:hypothetical protein
MPTHGALVAQAFSLCAVYTVAGATVHTQFAKSRRMNSVLLGFHREAEFTIEL